MTEALLGSLDLFTIWTLVLTALISFPLAVGAAIYLEEYAPRPGVHRACRSASPIAG